MIKFLKRFFSNNKKIITYSLFVFMLISLTWSVNYFLEKDAGYKAELKIKQDRENSK